MITKWSSQTQSRAQPQREQVEWGMISSGRPRISNEKNGDSVCKKGIPLVLMRVFEMKRAWLPLFLPTRRPGAVLRHKLDQAKLVTGPPRHESRWREKAMGHPYLVLCQPRQGQRSQQVPVVFSLASTNLGMSGSFVNTVESQVYIE